MKKLNLLIPSAGRPTHPSLLKCLRDNGEREVRIVGVDISADGLAPNIVDKFYQVPPRKDPAYLETILTICRKEAIDVYYALGEEEAIAAAERISDFSAVNTSVITPGTAEMLGISTNKCRWHDYFNQQGIPHANYRNLYSSDALEAAAHQLGYPSEDIFIKPAISKGGRGARVITSKNIAEEYFTDRSAEPRMSLESFINLLRPLPPEKFVPLLMMEYLPGTYYSIDVLSKNGQPYYVIPKIRIEGTASNTSVGQVDLNSATIDLATKACRAFNFSYLQNYEMKLNKQNQPMIYDINPRGGASLALCAAAGANIAYYAVKMAVGEEVPLKQIKDKVKMIRFYDELYI
jgi:carbamoyl-phosphate synthase large subunit